MSVTFGSLFRPAIKTGRNANLVSPTSQGTPGNERECPVLTAERQMQVYKRPGASSAFFAWRRPPPGFLTVGCEQAIPYPPSTSADALGSGHLSQRERAAYSTTTGADSPEGLCTFWCAGRSMTFRAFRRLRPGSAGVVAVEQVLSRWERCPERSGGRIGDRLSLPDRQLQPPIPSPRRRAGSPVTGHSTPPGPRTGRNCGTAAGVA